MINKKHKRGFTLIELLVVVLIIGILAAIALPKYQVAVAKSRISQELSIVKTLTQAQEAHKLVHGQYAVSLEELDISLPDFVECFSSNDTTIYYNGKTQIGIRRDVWGSGPSYTRRAACGWQTGKGVSATIVARIPGSSTCPASRNSTCFECSADKSSGSVEAERKACASFGPFVGETMTTYVYDIAK